MGCGKHIDSVRGRTATEIVTARVRTSREREEWTRIEASSVPSHILQFADYDSSRVQALSGVSVEDRCPCKPRTQAEANGK